MKTNTREEIREKLSELEHDQWMKWASTLMEKENLSPERIERWKKDLVPYSELPEDVKDYDRKWADKALVIVEALIEKEKKEAYEHGYSDGYTDCEGENNL